MDTSARTDVYDVVTRSHDILIMLYDDDGIADLSQLVEIGDQEIIVSRVETDRWLIEHIDDSLELGANLGRETDTLSLTS